MPKATKRERQRQNREIRRQAMLTAERRRRRLRALRALAIPLVILVVVFVIIALTRGGDDEESSAAATPVRCVNREPTAPVKQQTYAEPPPMTIDVEQEYRVVMHTSCGEIEVDLDPKQAPQTVNSFLFLVQHEYYNGTTFHRIVTDFVDQGGDQTGDGTGGPGYALPDEPPADGYEVGDVAMANSGPNTTGSQFFLVVSEEGAAQLNAGGPPYKYSILGHMDAKGLRVARKINTFGSSDQAGTPTRTIYLFDVGIIFGRDSTTTSSPAPTTTVAP